MAIDDYIRQSMWQNHKKKCFYCDIFLPYKNIQIDHIIPQVIFSSSEDETRKKYLLSADFDFNFLENLVPSCQNCNTNRKVGKELSNGIPIWLEIASKKKKKIISDASKIRDSLSLDIPEEYKDFFLTSRDFILSGMERDRIRKADIPLYKEARFSKSFNSFYLTSRDLEPQWENISRLSEYEIYKEKGYFARSTKDKDIASICEAYLFFFSKFKDAVQLEKHVDLKKYYKHLPAELINSWNGDNEIYESTIKNFIQSKPAITVEHIGTSIRITVPFEEGGRPEIFTIKEVLQANFSGSDETEAILFISFQSGGNMRWSFATQVRFSNGKWLIVDRY